MDLNRIYKNPGLEARRLEFMRQLRGEQALREANQASRSVQRQIQQGFERYDKSKTAPLSKWIAECALKLDANERSKFRALLTALGRRGSKVLSERKLVIGLSHLARFWPRWLREPTFFDAHSYNASRQFGELARFLLARWPVPKCFDDAWGGRATDAHREWFIHIGSGGNLRTAEGLPFPLTKMMSHHAMHAPDDVSVIQALRWGQVRALGGSERLARAVIASALREAQTDEPFWITVVHFFTANPMLDPRQVGPVVDWIRNQRFVAEPHYVENGVVRGGGVPQPNLSMKGRTAESVLRQVELWHRQLNRESKGKTTGWPSCGIAGFERIEGPEGAQKIIRIDEIVTSAELLQEGRTLRHCVASYARSCAQGVVAIFSLKVDGGGGFDRRLTIEIDLRSKRVVQARGRFNAMPQPVDERYLRGWASQRGLIVAVFY